MSLLYCNDNAMHPRVHYVNIFPLWWTSLYILIMMQCTLECAALSSVFMLLGEVHNLKAGEGRGSSGSRGGGGGNKSNSEGG
jgi:hypothetical protein